MDQNHVFLALDSTGKTLAVFADERTAIQSIHFSYRKNPAAKKTLSVVREGNSIVWYTEGECRGAIQLAMVHTNVEHL